MNTHMNRRLFSRRRLWAGASLVGTLGIALGVFLWRELNPPATLSPEARAALYQTPLEPPERGLAVYHLGHSLVGPDMPGYVQQLAQAAGHEGARYHSQLGWGTSLRAHWEQEHPEASFAEMNTHTSFRPAHEALVSAEYDAFVFTEMVDLKDAIRWHASGQYAGKWAAHAREHSPEMRLYLYETWHGTDIADGWLARLEGDLETLWEGTILAQAMARPDVGTIHVIPAGQVMAAFVRALESEGGLPGLKNRHGLFIMQPDGTRDPIHLNDKGKYLVALVHLTTLYHIDPRGLPHALLRADGSAADAPSPEVARLMQEVVWQIVRSLPATGLPQDTGRGGS